MNGSMTNKIKVSEDNLHKTKTHNYSYHSNYYPQVWDQVRTGAS